MSGRPSVEEGDGSRTRVVALVLVLAGLTLHTLVLMLLLGGLGLPAKLGTVLSAWKEVLAGVAAAALLGWVLLSRARNGFRLAAADLLSGVLIVLVLAEGAWVAATSHLLSLTAVLYGMRFYLVPLAAYVVGRLLPVRRSELRTLLWVIVLVGALTGLVSLFERLVTDRAYVDLVESLGYKRYFADYVNEVLSGPGPTGASTWVDAGHGIGRRAGSVFLVSKPYALALLLSIPAAVALLACSRGRRRQTLWMVTFLLGLGLALTYTRAGIVAGVLIAAILAGLLRRWQVLPAFLIGLLLGVGLFYAESRYANPPGGLRPVAGASQVDLGRLSINTSSDLEHASVWRAALNSGLQRPILGWGPGTGNEDSNRFVTPAANSPITLGAESVLFQIFEELGAVGLLLYLALLAAIAVAAWRLFRRSRPGEVDWLQGAVMLAMTVGVVGIGTTTPIWSGAFVLTYGYWWLAGLTVQLTARAEETIPTGAAEDFG